MIEIRGLTVRYGPITAVHDLTTTIRPGVVTGFLGPNGAGKSTTMRAAVGLSLPTAGEVLVRGRRYRDHDTPLREVGALLDPLAVHPRRRARHHLAALAASNGLSRRRVGEVLELVGLSEVADRRAGAFSLGMSQRLGLAAALLGDPPVLILDEPVNGLDPDGIIWIRQLLRSLASEGRTVLVSSHLMSEMALTADHLVVLGRGRLRADLPLAEVLRSAEPKVRVRTPQAGRLRALLVGAATTVTGSDDELVVTGMGVAGIADLALRYAVPVHELVEVQDSLEAAYLALTGEDVEFAAATTGPAPATVRGVAA